MKREQMKVELLFLKPSIKPCFHKQNAVFTNNADTTPAIQQYGGHKQSSNLFLSWQCTYYEEINLCTARK